LEKNSVDIGQHDSKPNPLNREIAIELSNIHLSYKSKTGSIHALEDVNIKITDHTFVSVIGPSGCGKSTLLKLVSGVLNPTEGKIRIYGQSLHEVDIPGKIGFMFQRPLLLPWRTAIENVLLPYELRDKEINESHIEKAREMLSLTGLEQFMEKSPHELSGGMQQRVSLARALVTQPGILLMDEPLSALDEITRETMQVELLRIWQKTQNTILFVTHSIHEAALLSDKIVVLSQRPGTVLRVFDIDLPRPRDEAMRLDPDFLRKVEMMRDLLRDAEELELK
jgi:NitT/TauT family transport system ATP-binding protein